MNSIFKIFETKLGSSIHSENLHHSGVRKTAPVDQSYR